MPVEDPPKGMSKMITKNAQEIEEARIQAYEDEGMTRSDAQGIVEAENMKAGRPAITAYCSPEIADWLDPNGALRRAGLLSVA